MCLILMKPDFDHLKQIMKEVHSPPIELYQDQYINGKVIVKGKRDCEPRYEAIKQVFQKYNRPFTVLDVGANLGYYSIRASHDFDVVSVMIENKPNEARKLVELCSKNTCKSKLIVLNYSLGLVELKELTKCEHFDVVLALNIIHHFPNKDIENICEVFTKLGDNLIIETPPIGDEGTCGKDNIEYVYNFFKSKDHIKLGEFKRHTSSKNSEILCVKTPKTELKWPYFRYEEIFHGKTQEAIDVLVNRGTNIIKSNYNEKYIQSPRKDKPHEWIPGINLKTFLDLNGIYPPKRNIADKVKSKEIKTDYAWDNSNNDFVVHNLILNGHDIHLIDYDDDKIIQTELSDEDQLRIIYEDINPMKFTWENSAKTAYDIIQKFKLKPWKHWTSDDGSTLHFIPNIDCTITCKIIDGYTKLNYYTTVMDVKAGISYFVKHGYASEVNHKIFQVILDGKTIIHVENFDGKHSIGEFDKDGILLNYKNVPKNDKTLALPLYEIFVGEIYNHKFCNIQPGDIVFDIGANIGLFSLYAYYRGCKCSYAFEPIPRLYETIKENLGHISSITINNLAVSNKTETANFYVPKDEPIGASLYDTHKKYKKEQDIIQCHKKSFNDFCQENNIEKIDYLKLDCEGEEYNIINSIPDNFFKNIRKIAIEFHDNKGQLTDIIDKFERCGFEYEFRGSTSVDSEIGMLYAWKKFSYGKFMEPYREMLKKSGESRLNFFDYVIQKLVNKKQPLTILETGTMWSGLDDNMGAFTYIIGDLLKNWTGGKLITVDISQENIEKCKVTTKEFSDNIEYICSDSVEYLKSLSDDEVRQLDLVYLDSVDLYVPDPRNSAGHHLNELKTLYDRLSDDVIIAVDDNYLPNTIVRWNWMDEDGKITGSKLFSTEDKIIGKGMYIHDFLTNHGWKRMDKFDIPHDNNVLYYERSEIPKERVKSILNKFYKKQSTNKPIVKPFNHKLISSDCTGLGDAVILTPFTKDKIVDCKSTVFPALMLYNEHFTNPVYIPKNGFTNISEYAKYNWNGGHAIQRITRALGLPGSDIPRGYVKFDRNVVKNRIGYHLNRGESGIHNLSSENIKIFNYFKDKHDEYSFFDLSIYTENSDIRGLIEFLSTCEFFIGINSGPMHIAAALDVKSIIIVNSPDQLYLPKIKECEIPESEWLYPQNVHLHTNKSNELVPKFNLVNLERAINGNVYPYFKTNYCDIKYEPQYKILSHFVNGPFVEITGDDTAEFKINFIDKDQNKIVYSTKTHINHWHRANRQWLTNWLLEVHRENEKIWEHHFDPTGKRIYISFDSSSLGDTIAWSPYPEEFRKKHKCHVILSTFHNHLFKDGYPEIEWVEPGTRVENLYAQFKIGCYDGDRDKNKVDWKTREIQRVICDILNLDFREIVPFIREPIGERIIEGKYVCISEHSTAGCKYWNRPGGWQAVVKYLKKKGYKMVVISKEKTNLKGIINETNQPLERTMINLKYCDFYIGVSSGPAWLAWGMRKPTIMISGFSHTFHEYKSNVERIINTNVCHGCFNNERYTFDRGDWNWCPKHQGTSRQFECTKKIPPEYVYKAIEKIINNK